MTRNLSGIPRETWLGRLLRLPLRILPRGLVLPILQGPLRGWRWIVGSSNHGCWLGSYEYEQSQLFADHIDPGSVVCDVGAHVGWYTLLASVLVGPEGRVFAFEPSARNLTLLEKHLHLNQVRNVSVIEGGLGAETGRGWFHEAKVASVGRVEAKKPGGIPVQTYSLDDLVLGGSVPPPDVIKIDVEGGEVDVLRGARGLLERQRVIIFISTHGASLKRECGLLLQSYGYDLCPIDHDSVEIASEFLATPSA